MMTVFSLQHFDDYATVKNHCPKSKNRTCIQRQRFSNGFASALYTAVAFATGNGF
jgi:hypothetical protein